MFQTAAAPTPVEVINPAANGTPGHIENGVFYPDLPGGVKQPEDRVGELTNHGPVVCVTSAGVCGPAGDLDDKYGQGVWPNFWPKGFPKGVTGVPHEEEKRPDIAQPLPEEPTTPWCENGSCF